MEETEGKNSYLHLCNFPNLDIESKILLTFKIENFILTC